MTGSSARWLTWRTSRISVQKVGMAARPSVIRLAAVGKHLAETTSGSHAGASRRAHATAASMPSSARGNRSWIRRIRTGASTTTGSPTMIAELRRRLLQRPRSRRVRQVLRRGLRPSRQPRRGQRAGREPRAHMGFRVFGGGQLSDTIRRSRRMTGACARILDPFSEMPFAQCGTLRHQSTGKSFYGAGTG